MELRRQPGANRIYLFIRTTLERCLIAFIHWTDPLANERLIGSDRAQEHRGVINRENGREEGEKDETVAGRCRRSDAPGDGEAPAAASEEGLEGDEIRAGADGERSR